MRKFTITLIAAFVALVAFSQERTVTKKMDIGAYTIMYYGQAADTLTGTNQDTIDFVVQYRANDFVKKVSLRTRFDLRSTADTTVKISVLGKEYLDDANWVSIIGSTTTSAIAANNTVVVNNSDYTETIGTFDAIVKQFSSTANTDTITYPAQTITPLDKTYQWYLVRYIISGDDFTGSGLKIDEIQLQLFK